MPDQISVSEFLSETTEDYNSPTTSSFTTRMQSCRNTVNVLEEVRPRCEPVEDGWIITATQTVILLLLLFNKE
uniref:Arf-GAP domain-containing protein n=3 Tax=Pseudocrenilabrinae TaxID=318546 RepID=A0A3Q4H6T6_NEOBR